MPAPASSMKPMLATYHGAELWLARPALPVLGGRTAGRPAAGAPAAGGASPLAVVVKRSVAVIGGCGDTLLSYVQTTVSVCGPGRTPSNVALVVFERVTPGTAWIWLARLGSVSSSRLK